MSKVHKELYKGRTRKRVISVSVELYVPATQSDVRGWGVSFISAVKVIRDSRTSRGGLRGTLDFMANEFGFADWSHWQPWLRDNQCDFSSVTGPHALTILKMIAIKHGRAKRE